MKIVTIVGARPQFIKAAAISRAIAEYNCNAQVGSGCKVITEIIVHTGQHFDDDMSEIFFREMDIPLPNYRMNINSMGHGAMTGQMLEKVENILIQEQPDCVMVYGDTNTTLAGALAAKKLHIAVVHVEAGLRSNNMQMPEEINRILVDRLSDVLFCPTDLAVENLRKEGFENFPVRIVRTGDVMLDTALYYSRFSADNSDIISHLGLENVDCVLCTIHRAENTDDLTRLGSIMEALEEIGRQTTVVLPIHPRTAKCLNLLSEQHSFFGTNLCIIPPVGYFDMIELLKHARIVVTDSGGLQKEAYFFSKPCITLRNETEWSELVDSGCNYLAGADRVVITRMFNELKSKSLDFSSKLYGMGKASDEIINILLSEPSLRGNG